MPVDRYCDLVKPRPALLSIWLTEPVAFKRAVRSVVDVFVPMASGVASQLCLAAARAEEFSRLARSASSSEMANAGDDVIPMHPMKNAALTVWRIFSLDMSLLPII